jgi:hypothetical protein
MVSGGLFNGNFAPLSEEFIFRYALRYKKAFFTLYQQGKMEQNFPF